MVKKYRKRPIEIEAIQWNGNNIEEVNNFVDKDQLVAFKYDVSNYYSLIIKTLEGSHKADIGDYIIKGVKGEFYPCKPDIFEMTYDEVKE